MNFSCFYLVILPYLIISFSAFSQHQLKLLTGKLSISSQSGDGIDRVQSIGGLSFDKYTVKMLQVNTCLYLSKGLAEYVAVLDVDELFIPKGIHSSFIDVLNGVLQSTDEDAELEDMDALIGEADELETRISLRKKRIDEINERRSWNADNICQTKEEKTIVNAQASSSLRADDFIPTGATDKAFPRAAATSIDSNIVTSTTTAASSVAPASKKSAPAVVAGPIENTGGKSKGVTGSGSRDHHAIVSYNDFVLSHEAVLEEYSDINDMEATKDYLFKHCGVLLHEHAQSYMLLSSLEDEMNGKRERMKRVCRQSQILTHIQELATSMKRDPRDVVLPFFKRISEPEHLAGFKSSVDDFVERIVKRSVEKRQEMDAEGEYEENDQLGPGGLNPYEVLKSLPKTLRDAFESQDIGRLHKVLGEMEVGEAKRLMKQCVDSGLWVAKDNSIFGEDGESEGKE